jgi:hypothetical protein
MGRGGNRWYHNRIYWGPSVPAEQVSPDEIAKGAVYVGPCRCGHGPHAYYRTADGRIVHASSRRFETNATTPEPEPARDELREELESLLSRVRELEEKLKAKSEAGKR